MPRLLAAMGCPGDVAESVLGHMIPGVTGAYNRHQYDAERVEWLRRLSERLEDLARQGGSFEACGNALPDPCHTRNGPRVAQRLVAGAVWAFAGWLVAPRYLRIPARKPL